MESIGLNNCEVELINGNMPMAVAVWKKRSANDGESNTDFRKNQNIHKRNMATQSGATDFVLVHDDDINRFFEEPADDEMAVRVP